MNSNNQSAKKRKPAKPVKLHLPLYIEDGFIFDARGVRIADCHCDDSPISDKEQGKIAAIMVEACNGNSVLTAAIQYELDDSKTDAQYWHSQGNSGRQHSALKRAKRCAVALKAANNA